MTGPLMPSLWAGVAAKAWLSALTLPLDLWLLPYGGPWPRSAPPEDEQQPEPSEGPQESPE